MAQKIRICFFNTTRFWGGGEQWHLETARFMASCGHMVTVVGHPGAELLKRLGKQPEIKTVPLAVSNASFINPFKIRKLVRLFRSAGFQAIVFNGSSDVKIGAPAARMACVPVVVYRRGLAVPARNSVLNRLLYGRLVTHLLTNSKETEKVFFKYLKIPNHSDKTRTIYNGVDLSRFEFSGTEHLRQERGAPVIIGTAGRLEVQKGHEHLLAVARLLKQRGLSFRLLIAGEGSLYQHLEEKIQAWGLKRTVTLLGFVKDMGNFMQHIDIFAFPSLWEGFGYAAAEAMAALRPIVAFDVSSNREIVENDSTGFLVPKGSLDEFAYKIEQLASDPGLRAKMGQKGKARVIATFERGEQLRKTELFLCQTVLENEETV